MKEMVHCTKDGITLAEYKVRLARQGGGCAICRRTGARFHVDHCHLTGRVRGILCQCCNHAIGLIRGNAGTAHAMAGYLETCGHTWTEELPQ
jgi:hypothetical protein